MRDSVDWAIIISEQNGISQNMASPTIDSISRESTISTYINEHIDYLSGSLDETSPLTISDSSPPPNQLILNSAGSSGSDNESSTVTTNNNSTNNNTNNKKALATILLCKRHNNETLKHFCLVCLVPTCKICDESEHRIGFHTLEPLNDVLSQQLDIMTQSLAKIKQKLMEVQTSVANIDQIATRFQSQYNKALSEIGETSDFYRAMLEERKGELYKDLETVYSTKQMSLSLIGQRSHEYVEKIAQTCSFMEQILKCSNVADILMCRKFFDDQLRNFQSFNPAKQIHQITSGNLDLEFVSNFQTIQNAVRTSFGYVRTNADLGQNIMTQHLMKQPPIARPSNNLSLTSNSIAMLNGYANGISNGGSASNCNGSGSSGGSSIHGSSGSLNGSVIHSLNGNGCVTNGFIERPFSNGIVSSNSQSTSPFETTIISKRFSSVTSLGPFTNPITDLAITNGLTNFDKWSNGNDLFQNGNIENDAIIDLSSKLMSSSVFPPKSQIKRQKMIYHCKFGEFGVMEGQFTEPSGVAVNAQNDIIVADTNNHRIQIFDKEGRFKFQFGECGKRDGQLLYPNRVAVVKSSGDIIVTERSPTHQIQIYNQYGQFVRKFGANILQHPRGVTVDSQGRIVVVECKVMRVIIFDQNGSVLQKFGCSKHLEFPNGVVVNEKQEIFISDNRAHCVKVFNYEGTYLRQIGGEGITNYPIGVGISNVGEILIADNHNNFNLTIFTQDGQLLTALESKVKHAQCFDVSLMDDGSVVLASKDYRLYIYRYIQVPPVGI